MVGYDMHLYLRIDGKPYYGSAAEIVRELRSSDHGRTPDVDAYIRRVSTDLHFAISGENTAERCQHFLEECIRTGWAIAISDH